MTSTWKVAVTEVFKGLALPTSGGFEMYQAILRSSSHGSRYTSVSHLLPVCAFVPGLWGQDGPCIEPCRDWGCIVYTTNIQYEDGNYFKAEEHEESGDTEGGEMGLKVQEVSDGKLGSRPALSPMNQNFSRSK